MSRVVIGSNGEPFELEVGAAASSGSHLSLRARLDQVVNLRAVLDEPSNRTALGEALVEGGLATPDQVAGWSPAELRHVAEQAFMSGDLSLAPLSSVFRPVADVHERAAPLVSEAEEAEPLECTPDDPQAQGVITVAEPRVVLVKKAHQAQAHRLRVTVSAQRPDGGAALDLDADGQLTWTAADAIHVFPTARGGTSFTSPVTLTSDELTRGRDFWVEGVAPSGAMDDVELQVALTQRGRTAVVDNGLGRKTLTVVELTIDVCLARDPANAAADPVVIAQDEKVAEGRLVHVQAADPLPRPAAAPAPNPADRLPHDRAKIIVRAARPAAFTGTLVVRACDGNGADAAGRVALFQDEVAAKSQAALPVEHEIPYAAGFTDVVLWAQGQQASAAMRDAGIKVGVRGVPAHSGGLADGDRVTLTVLRTELATCKSRTAAPTGPADLPAKLALADKHQKGRFVHRQQELHHGRGGLVVAKVEPGDYRGKLELVVWDKTADAAANPRVELFEAEVPATGQAAVANPLEVDYDGATWPAAGKAWWIQGKTTSGALVDTEVRLGIRQHINVADRAPVTVVELTNLRATVPITPPNTARGAPMNNVPAAPQDTHLLTIAGTAADHYSEEMRSGQPKLNDPLVLIEGSLPAARRVRLEVTVAPVGVPVLWSANRDRRAAPLGDHADVINLAGNRPSPSLAAVAGNPLQQDLALDAVGSFHVRPFVDCNGSGRYEDTDPATGKRIDREPFALMNLVLVRAELTAARHTSVAQPANASITLAGGAVRVSTGAFANGAGAGVHCIGQPDVVGGGRDGLLGLDKVFAGWVNNEQPHAASPAVPPCEDAVATYTAPAVPPAGPTVHQVFSFWTTPAAGNFTRYGPGTPLPPRHPGPMLDTTNFGNEGVGGDRAVGCEGAIGPPVPIAKTARPGAAAGTTIGQRWRVEMWDSPGDGAPVAHPFPAARPTARMTAYRFNLNFRADLVFWTSQARTKAPQQNATPSDRLYGTVATCTWTITASYTIAPGPPMALVPVTALTLGLARAQSRARPVEGSGLEVRFPITLRTLALDCTG